VSTDRTPTSAVESHRESHVEKIAGARDTPAAPTTEAGRRYIEKLHRDDAGMQRLSSGRFHLGAVITDAEDAVAQIEAEARSTPAEALPLRAALERLLAVSMTEEEDVSPATQDEWIAAIKQANDAIDRSTPAEALDVERLAAAMMEAHTPGYRGDKRYEAMHRRHAVDVADWYARLSPHNREADQPDYISEVIGNGDGTMNVLTESGARHTITEAEYLAWPRPHNREADHVPGPNLVYVERDPKADHDHIYPASGSIGEPEGEGT
jgi:hypothetical protein